MASWLIFLPILFLPFLCQLANHQYGLKISCHHFPGANAERSLSCILAEAREDFEQYLKAPLSDDDKHEFLARWTTWQDGRMAVADQIRE